MSGVTSNRFRAGREIIPEEGDEPLGREIVLPLVSGEFLKHLGVRSGLLMDPLEFLVQVGSRES